MKIGSKSLTEQIETVDHNHKRYLNIKKFEDSCKRHSMEEKTDLVQEWC